jgi:hypothetical protein
MIDLPTAAFLQLRRRFFDEAGKPIPFALRDKRNTQDDPFDEFLALSGIFVPTADQALLGNRWNGTRRPGEMTSTCSSG